MNKVFYFNKLKKIQKTFKIFLIRKSISPFIVQASMTVKENGLFQKKAQTGGAEDIFFEALPPSPPWIYFFNNLYPWIYHKILLDPLEIQCQKQRPRKIPHYFFLVTLGNSTFIQPLEIPHTISLIPLEIPYLNPCPLFGFFLE